MPRVGFPARNWGKRQIVVVGRGLKLRSDMDTGAWSNIAMSCMRVYEVLVSNMELHSR